MAKADKFYFENFIKAADCSLQSARYLVEILKDYNPEELQSSMAKMHKIENDGDSLKHEMSAALAKAFVTPVDREDLALISKIIDDVTDSIDEVLQRFYVDGIKTVLPEAIVFAEKLVQCCSLMKDMLAEFPNFKKPKKLHEMIVELNHKEEECDALYVEALLSVKLHCTDILDIIFWREIYDCMETCADSCEHVGDSIETVVMKNT